MIMSHGSATGFVIKDNQMYSFVARQPILDDKLRTYAYELLFRKGLSNVFPNVSSEEATTALLTEQFLNQPIESLVGDKIAFINFPYSLIIDGLAGSLPRNKVVIEILEDATPNEALLESVKELKRCNYRIALDDFTLEPAWDKFLPFIDIIKFDWKLTSTEVIKNYVQGHRSKLVHIMCLAEKIETLEEFNTAKKLGFKLFQGYFFSKPEIVRNKSITSNQLSVTQLFTEIVKDNLDYEKIELIFSQDQALTYRLLRYVNNIRYGTNDLISSIRHAVVFLGRDNLKRFVILMWSTSMKDGKPSELSKMSLVRARFCELLAKARNSQIDTHEVFMSGLLSLLDVMMDKSFEEILGSLPISERIKTALIEKKGELSFYIGLVIDYENMNWARIKLRVSKLNLTEQNIIDIFLEATQWANTILSEK